MPMFYLSDYILSNKPDIISVFAGVFIMCISVQIVMWVIRRNQ